jgi:ABC-type multidrug transport system fused ATPase/permease subunit
MSEDDSYIKIMSEDDFEVLYKIPRGFLFIGLAMVFALLTTPFLMAIQRGIIPTGLEGSILIPVMFAAFTFGVKRLKSGPHPRKVRRLASKYPEVEVESDGRQTHYISMKTENYVQDESPLEGLVDLIARHFGAASIERHHSEEDNRITAEVTVTSATGDFLASIGFFIYVMLLIILVITIIITPTVTGLLGTIVSAVAAFLLLLSVIMLLLLSLSILRQEYEMYCSRRRWRETGESRYHDSSGLLMSDQNNVVRQRASIQSPETSEENKEEDSS